MFTRTSPTYFVKLLNQLEMFSLISISVCLWLNNSGICYQSVLEIKYEEAVNIWC